MSNDYLHLRNMIDINVTEDLTIKVKMRYNRHTIVTTSNHFLKLNKFLSDIRFADKYYANEMNEFLLKKYSEDLKTFLPETIEENEEIFIFGNRIFYKITPVQVAQLRVKNEI